MTSTVFARRTARGLVACTLVAILSSASAAFAFDFDDVAALARRKAGAPFVPQDRAQPRELELLGYDRYRDIRFKPDRAWWRSAKLPFELMFFHQGLYYNQPVRMNEISPEGVHEIPFDPELFDYGVNRIDPKALKNLGYAGFRVHYSINSPRYKDEVLVFLGASYFRALGRGQRYGISARGLAIYTALMSGKRGNGGSTGPTSGFWPVRLM